MSHLLDAIYVMSQKACWGEFSIVIYGNMAYVQMAAAFAYRGNTELASHSSRVPASTFSTVVVQTLCDFV